MKQGNRAVALAVVLACWLSTGCGESTNEEGFNKGGQGQVTRPEGMPNFQNQGEYEAWKAEQARKNKSLPVARNRTQAGSKPGRR